MSNLTLIIPAKNESESLPKVLYDLADLNYKIIISVGEDDLDTINSIKKYDVKIGENLNDELQQLLTEKMTIHTDMR